MLIEIVQKGEKFIKCTLCSAKLHSLDKSTLFDHLLGKKHIKILQKYKDDLRLIQKPEITENAETIGDLMKRLDDDLQRNSNSMLIELVQNGEKFIKCTLCSAIMRPCDKKGMSMHLSGNKHRKLLQIHKNDLQSIQKPEITEKDEIISDLKKRLEDELQNNSTSMLIETVYHGERFIKCTLCSKEMRSNDKTTISDHLLGKKHKKQLQLIQKPEITEKAETISELKKQLDDELQRNSTLTDYLTICKLIMNNVQDFSVQPCSKTAFSSHITSDDDKNDRRDMGHLAP